MSKILFIRYSQYFAVSHHQEKRFKLRENSVGILEKQLFLLRKNKKL